MHDSLRASAFTGYDARMDNGATRDYLMTQGVFNKLVSLDDGHMQAYNLLSIMLWVNGLSSAFANREIARAWALVAPVPPLESHQVNMIHRFHQMLPIWLQNVPPDELPGVFAPADDEDRMSNSGQPGNRLQGLPRARATPRPTQLMRDTLRDRTFAEYDERLDDGALRDRFLKDPSFDLLADLGDDYASAHNKLAIALWVYGIANRFYATEIYHSLHVQRPIPTLRAHLPVVIARFHRMLPPTLRWLAYVPQFEGAHTFGLPSYELLVQQKAVHTAVAERRAARRMQSGTEGTGVSTAVAHPVRVFPRSMVHAITVTSGMNRNPVQPAMPDSIHAECEHGAVRLAGTRDAEPFEHAACTRPYCVSKAQRWWARNGPGGIDEIANIFPPGGAPRPPINSAGHESSSPDYLTPSPTYSLPASVAEPIAKMRLFLRQQTYAGCDNPDDDGGSEAARLMGDYRFDELASLDDDYVSAYNKLSVVLWLSAGSDAEHDGCKLFWEHMTTEAFKPGLDKTHAARMLADNIEQIGMFVEGEFEAAMNLDPPIQSLDREKPFITARFYAIFDLLDNYRPSPAEDQSEEEFACELSKTPRHNTA
jgi:hypothetical protein